VDAVNPSDVYGTDAQVMDYLRGNRTLEVSQVNGRFRNRTSLLGPVVNSEPIISRDDNVLFVQSGEGMLHAFSVEGSNAGQELWAFVPRAALPNIGATTRPGYIYSTKLDGLMSLRRIDATTNLLVAGMGAAGKSYHALNVHAPTTITEANRPAVWEFPAASDTANQAKMGLAMGKPRIVRTAAGLRVLVTSGYETPDGQGRLWMLNPTTGAVVREFVTNSGGTTSARAELAHVTGYSEDDGTTRYAYGGDLQGNVWRFDLDDTSGTGSSGVNRLALLRDSAGAVQPVAAAPELTNIEGQRVVIVGTGRLLSESDLAGSGNQSVYAIADGGDIGNARAATGTNALIRQTYTNATTTAAATITDNAVNWSNHRGWYVDLPAGEKVLTTPQLARGSLLFASNSTDVDCGASSKLYALDVTNGGPIDGAADLSPSTPISTSSNVTALALLQTSDGRLFVSGRLTGSGDLFGQTNTNPAQTFTRRVPGDTTISPKINAWRESRKR
jgi:type IV pilus assembly protein PilY1